MSISPKFHADLVAARVCLEDEEDEVIGAIDEKETEMDGMRIYIGGVGATVTENDITKTFTAPSLGTVTSVEIIRTKERSFAYFDFLPCSDKGLAKLFSTYNGCKWKGGSLRLEKAKEHYLQQLRREWEEDTQLAGDFHEEDGDAATNDVLPTFKPKKLPDLDKMQLKIFFPRLGKVKAVPFKGTGKHKYSFQRVEALSLPTHFCDCEEHSGAPDVDKEHQRHDDAIVNEDSFDDCENEKGEIDEQELTMMNSVMNKLFEREVFSEANRKCGSSTERTKNVKAIGDLPPAEDQLDQMSDEDNLIINIVGGSKNKGISNQDLCLKELRNSKSRPQNLQTSKQKMAVTAGEKRKQLKDDNTRTVSDVTGRKIRKILPSDKNEKANLSHSKGTRTSDISVSKNSPDAYENAAEPQNNVSATIHCKPGQLQKSSPRDLSTDVDSSTFGISSSAPTVSPGNDFQSGSDILGKPHAPEEEKDNSSLQIREPKVSDEVLSGSEKSIPDRATKGASWLQKLSWTQLVGGSESSSFSISQILPNTNYDKQEIQQPPVFDFSSPKQTAHVLAPQELSKTVLHGAHENLVGASVANQIDGQINEASSSSAYNKQTLAAKRAVSDADETFAFVRTAASIKEFAKVKASLSGSLKKKGDKK